MILGLEVGDVSWGRMIWPLTEVACPANDRRNRDQNLDKQDD